MSQPLLLRGARQLLTLRGEPGARRGAQSGNLGIIEDGSIFIRDGKIVSVGATRRLENLKEVRGALQIPAHNCIVLPGLIDPYMEVGPGLRKTVQTSGKRRKADFQDNTLSLLRSCLQHGTLHAGIRTSLASSAKDSLSVLRKLTRIGNNPVGLTRFWRPDSCAGFDTAPEKRLFDALCLPASDTGDHLSGGHGLGLSLEWDGAFSDQRKHSLTGSSAPSVFCHHHLAQPDLRTLAASDAIAVFKACFSLLEIQLESGLRQVLDHGGAVAVGSGYDSVHEFNYNMQLVLGLAVRRLGLTIEEALVAATINAAYALGRGHLIGSLEPGKQADILMLYLADYREIPLRPAVNHVAMAIRNGEIAINRTRWRVGAA